MATVLHPIPRLWVRLPIWVALVAFFCISHASWMSKLGFAFWMAFFLGSYRVARIHEGWFERRMVFLFIPLRMKRWQLERFVGIETLWDEGMHVGWSLVIGPALWLWYRFFDLILPWMGGEYRIRLRHAKGGPVLAWQGNSDRHFHANIDILKANTGLPIQRAGR
jgi:hypothetical protein